MGGKLPRPGYLHPRGASCPEAASPPGASCPGWGQDTPGYLHPRGGKLPRGKLPRVQDKPVHRDDQSQLMYVQLNFKDPNTDGSFTLADSNSFVFVFFFVFFF